MYLDNSKFMVNMWWGDKQDDSYPPPTLDQALAQARPQWLQFREINK